MTPPLTLKSILELKKNVPPENENDMIVYIVGTKVDLAYSQRRVRPDRARFRLAQWFPPPRTPTPPGVNSKPHNGSAMMPYPGTPTKRLIINLLEMRR